jgi:hypothetical protein
MGANWSSEGQAMHSDAIVEPTPDTTPPSARIEVVRRTLLVMMLGRVHGMAQDVETIRRAMARLFGDDRVVRDRLQVADATAVHLASNNQIEEPKQQALRGGAAGEASFCCRSSS